MILIKGREESHSFIPLIPENRRAHQRQLQRRDSLETTRRIERARMRKEESSLPASPSQGKLEDPTI
jgi:hypothetical protein